MARTTASIVEFGNPQRALKISDSHRVTVRFATDAQDIENMIALGRLLHAESTYGGLPLDEARLHAIGQRGLASGNPALLIAEIGGDVIGMAIVLLGEYYFSSTLVATTQLLYVHSKARGSSAAVRLINGIRKWAAKNGAADIHINVTSGIFLERTDRFLRRLGFRQLGGNYVMKL